MSPHRAFLEAVSVFAVGSIVVAVSIESAGGVVSAEAVGDTSAAPLQTGEAGDPLPVYLDHVSIAVRDLDTAARAYGDRLGFALKPGRLHANSIENVHVKFADGSALELITASEPSDTVAGGYLDFLRSGDGPAFAALRTPDVEAIASRLAVSSADTASPVDATGERVLGQAPRLPPPPRILRGPYYEWLVFPDSHPLRYLFFTHVTRPPEDLPEHLSHGNGAHRLRAVWIARGDVGIERGLAQRLGLPDPTPASAPTPLSLASPVAKVEVIELDTGYIYLVEDRDRERLLVGPERPLVGITVDAISIDAVVGSLDPEVLRRAARGRDPRGQWLRVPPTLTHGV